MQTLIQRQGATVLLAALTVLCGCATLNPPPEIKLRFYEQVDPGLPAAYAREVQVPRSGLRLQVAVSPTLVEHDVIEAGIVETAGGSAVTLRFSVHGAIKLDEMTTRGRGRYVVAFMNDKPIAAVLIERRQTTGQFLLEGDFTDEQARQLVDSLNRGAKNQQRKWLNEKW